MGADGRITGTGNDQVDINSVEVLKTANLADNITLSSVAGSVLHAVYAGGGTVK